MQARRLDDISPDVETSNQDGHDYDADEDDADVEANNHHDDGYYRDTDEDGDEASMEIGDWASSLSP